MEIFSKSLLLALRVVSAVSIVVLLTTQFAAARLADDHLIKALNVAVVPTAEPTVLQVLVETPNSRPVLIELKNNEGDIVWDRQIRSEPGSFRFKLNLSEVPDGRYVVNVIHGKKRKSYAIRLQTSTLRRSIITG